MNYSKKDVLIGFVIVLAIILGLFLIKKNKDTKNEATPTPNTINYRQEIENNFNLDIPDDVKTYNLIDVSGGDGRGIATDNEILVDLNDPLTGYFYEAWLQDSNTKNIKSLGKMQFMKGGWLVEYKKDQYPSYNKIIVSLEKTFDNKLESVILEGSF